MYRIKRRETTATNNPPQRMIQMTSTTRFDHSNCDHAKSGNEGKKARAKCRKAHAEAAALAAAKPARKPRAKAAVSTTPRKPRVTKAKEPVSVPAADELDVPDL
jgi:hypothetical protein